MDEPGAVDADRVALRELLATLPTLPEAHRETLALRLVEGLSERASVAPAAIDGTPP